MINFGLMISMETIIQINLQQLILLLNLAVLQFYFLNYKIFIIVFIIIVW